MHCAKFTCVCIAIGFKEPRDKGDVEHFQKKYGEVGQTKIPSYLIPWD